MLSWEKVFMILGVVLLVFFAKSFSDTTRKIVRYSVGAILLVMALRHAPEAVNIVEKYADTMWPIIHTSTDRFIEAFGKLMNDVIAGS